MIDGFVPHVGRPRARGDAVVQEMPVEELVHPFDVAIAVERILPQAAKEIKFGF